MSKNPQKKASALPQYLIIELFSDGMSSGIEAESNYEHGFAFLDPFFLPLSNAQYSQT